MGSSEKRHATKSEARPPRGSDRHVSSKLRHDRLDVEGPPRLVTEDPSAYTRRSRSAQALLKQGCVEAAIDQLNAAIAISDEQVGAQFFMACELIDRGHLDEGVRSLRRASRIRLHKAIMRYALESAYYDHSAIELAMDEWRASLGLRGEERALLSAKGRAGGEVPPDPGASGGQRFSNPNGFTGVDRRMGQ